MIKLSLGLSIFLLSIFVLGLMGLIPFVILERKKQKIVRIFLILFFQIFRIVVFLNNLTQPFLEIFLSSLMKEYIKLILIVIVVLNRIFYLI